MSKCQLSIVSIIQLNMFAKTVVQSQVPPSFDIVSTPEDLPPLSQYGPAQQFVPTLAPGPAGAGKHMPQSGLDGHCQVAAGPACGKESRHMPLMPCPSNIIADLLSALCCIFLAAAAELH